MSASQDFSCCGYDGVEEWEDEFQLVATEDFISPSFNLPAVLSKCQEAVQPHVSTVTVFNNLSGYCSFPSI